MLKVLLIIFLVFFVLIRMSGFIMKLLFSNFVKKHQTNPHQSQTRQQKKPADGNVNIEYNPLDQNRNDQSKAGFKGGDYVDYEDVK